MYWAGILNTVGEVVVGWLSDQAWVSSTALYYAVMAEEPAAMNANDRNGGPKPRNPRHFESIEGGRDSVADTVTCCT